VGDDGRLMATDADYQTAKKLFLNSHETGPDKCVDEILTHAEGLRTFRVNSLIEKTGWGKSKVYAVLNRAEEVGCIAETENRGEYRFIRRSTIPRLNLPDGVE